MRLDAVLPAGGRIRGRLARETGTDIKALLPLAGATVLERTLGAVRATGRVRRVVVVGPPEVAPHAEGADMVLPEADSGAQNILRGLSWVSAAEAPPERVLVLTTDLPFLTAEAITGFLDACPPELEVCVPVITRREFESRFPRSAARCVRLRDGEWMIGCAFLLDPAAIMRNWSLVDRVFAARRNQFAMAGLLGPAFILRFLIGRLTVREIESKGLEILGCTGGAIRGCAPELGYDIDKRADYQYAVLTDSPAVRWKP